MKLCHNCGQALAEPIKICPSCGQEVADGLKYVDDYRIIDVVYENITTLIQNEKLRPALAGLFVGMD